MPLVQYDPNVGTQDYFNEPDPPEELPRGGLTNSLRGEGFELGAAMRLYNPVFNFLDYATAPKFMPDPTFNLTNALKENDLWDNDRYSFVGVRSQDEFDWTARKLVGERKDKQTLAAAGWAGVAASAFAGMFDPTILLPLTAGGRGLRAMAEGAALAAGGATAAEIVLQANQVDRSMGETAFSIGTATVVGGILGRAVGGASRPLAEMADAIDEEFTTGVHTVKPVEAAPAEPAVKPVEAAPAEPAGEFISVEDPRADGLVTSRSDVDGGIIFRGKLYTGQTHLDAIEKIRQEFKFDLAIEKEIDESAEFGYILKKPVDVEKTEDTIASSIGMSSLSAATARGDKGGFKRFLPKFTVAGKTVDLQVVAAKISPVVRTIEQEEFPTARFAMQQIDTAGMRSVGAKVGEIVSPQGTASDAALQWHYPLVTVLQEMDRLYAKHWFGDSTPGLMKTFRAGVGGSTRRTTRVGKMTGREWREAVADALNNNDQHAIAEVAEAAKIIRERVFDPMLVEGQKVGLYPKVEIKTVGDASYLMRLWDSSKIRANPNKLIGILARHFEAKMQMDFQKKLGKLQIRTGRTQARVDALRMPEEQAAAQLKFLQESLEKLKSDNPFEAAEEQIADLEDIIKIANRVDTGAPTARTDFSGRPAPAGPSVREQKLKAQEERKKIIESLGTPYEEFRGKRTEIRRAISNISRNRYLVANKLRDRLAKIDLIEEDAEDTLLKLAKAGKKFLNQLDMMTDEQLDKAIDDLNARFNKIGDRLNKTELRLEDELNAELKTVEGDAEIEKLFYRASKDNKILDDVLARIERIRPDNRLALRAEVQRALDHALFKTNDINLRRGQRIAKLKAAAGTLDPKIVDDEVKRLLAKIPKEEAKFRDELKEMGADDVDISGAHAVFGQFAKDQATIVVNDLSGIPIRAQGMDILQGLRGPELARLLDIESDSVKEFLERDVEKILKSYVRTLASDIEIARRFDGDPGARMEFKKLENEYNRGTETIDADEKLTAVQKKKKKFAYGKRYDRVKTDLQATIGRMRHTYGLPDNPDAIGWRLGQIALNWNVLRLMGMVTISSVSDPWRATMKYGMMNSFKDGIVPMITNWKTFKASAEEVKLAGTALDVVLHSRRNSIMDTMETIGHGNKFERGLEYATGKMGLMAGYDYWTSAMKQYSGVIINAYLVRSIKDVAETGGSRKLLFDTMSSREFLANVGIDEQIAKDMWKQISNSRGGDEVDGVWLPNTKAWTDVDLQRIYRTALAGEVDDTIITPGLERPLWVNKTMPGRLLSQFQSFGLSSAMKTQMAGLQNRNMATLNGVAGSIGFGMMSYYLWALAAGDRAYNEMMNAPLSKWVDEGIDRSGVMGFIGQFQKVADHLPFVMNTNIPGTNIPTRLLAGRFDDAPATRGEGQDIISTMMGPTFGAAESLTKFATGFPKPTRSTAHQGRVLFPLQNTWYFRRGFDKIERSFGLPESRR